jgi:hypothetical protein
MKILDEVKQEIRDNPEEASVIKKVLLIFLGVVVLGTILAAIF